MNDETDDDFDSDIKWDCIWELDSCNRFYKTECKNITKPQTLEFFSGKYLFCPYCGQKIHIKKENL